MPRDAHGIPHTGSHGLFDDDDVDELPFTGTDELNHMQKTSRCQAQEGARKAGRIARGKPAESKLSSMFAKVRSRKDGFERFDTDKEAPLKAKAEFEEAALYHDRGREIGAVESPWLQECGVIRVKSDDPGGCHIMAKPLILRNN